MIKRTLEGSLKKASRQFPVLAVLGPRQSGKTTLVRNIFPQHPYLSLEDPDTRLFAQSDPRAFLEKYQGGAIFDEAQKTPLLFSYLQRVVDERKSGMPFILTGSQNFLLHEKISQTLAGRVKLFTLLPLSMEELAGSSFTFRNANEFIFKGGYPRIYDKKMMPRDWYPSYIQTYLERDVRDIKHITDLGVFQKFLKLCAGRVGQLVNFSSLGEECGVSHNTIRSWISVLESSYIIFLLPPYYKNWKKRLVKMPKLYFYDTGLASSLLGIEDEAQLATHFLAGSLFENFVIAELIKHRLHRGRPAQFYFWRDKTGHEIDCIIEEKGQIVPIEIKAGKTVASDWFAHLGYFGALAKIPSGYIIYGGEEDQKRSGGNVVSFRNCASVIGAKT